MSEKKPAGIVSYRRYTSVLFIVLLAIGVGGFARVSLLASFGESEAVFVFIVFDTSGYAATD